MTIAVVAESEGGSGFRRDTSLWWCCQSTNTAELMLLRTYKYVVVHILDCTGRWNCHCGGTSSWRTCLHNWQTWSSARSADKFLYNSKSHDAKGDRRKSRLECQWLSRRGTLDSRSLLYLDSWTGSRIIFVRLCLVRHRPDTPLGRDSVGHSIQGRFRSMHCLVRVSACSGRRVRLWCTSNR